MPLINILIRDGREDTDRRGVVITEAETGVMQPEAENTHRRPQKLKGRERKHSSLEPSERAWPCRHLDFVHLASRTVREECLFFHITQCMVICYSSPGELRQMLSQVRSCPDAVHIRK